MYNDITRISGPKGVMDGQTHHFIYIDIRRRILMKPLGHFNFFSAICEPKLVKLFFLKGKEVLTLTCKISLS